MQINADKERKKIQKAKSAACTDVIRSRVIFHTNVTREMINLFKGVSRQRNKGVKTIKGS